MRRKVIGIIMAIVMFTVLLPGMTVKTAFAAEEDGLVLHLKFDGDMTDSSGNGNDAESTIDNFVRTTGIFGEAAYFNGTYYMEVKDDPSLDLETFTISFWSFKTANMEEDSKVSYIYKEEDEESWASPYCIFEYGDNLPYVYLHDNSGDTELNQFRLEGVCVDAYQWFLYTVTYDGTEVRIYQDGKLVRKESVTGFPSKTTGNLYIGMMDGENLYKGIMDDLRIYNRALSAKEVTGLYTDGVNANMDIFYPKDKIICSYSFTDNLKDANGHDLQTAAGEVSYIYGVKGKAVKIEEGTYFEAETSYDFNVDSEFTLTAWIKITKEGDYNTLLYKPGTTTSYNSNDYAYSIYLYDDCYEFDMVPFGYQPGTESYKYNFEDSTVNHWVNLAVTYDTNEVRWYINGKLVNKEEISDEYGTKISHSDGKLMIGSDGKYQFEGAIDDLALYNFVLPASEIAAQAKFIDSLSVSEANQNSIKAMKAKQTVTLETSRHFIETGKDVKLTSGVTYRSSNNKVFTVSSKGVIKAVNKGTATLTISHGGIVKTYKITVK